MQNAQNKKKRHWCLFAYLVLTLIANAFLSFVYFKTSTIQPQTADQSLIPQWYFQVVGILCLFNLISAFAILKWKKWGFWLFTLTACVTLCLNLYAGVSIGSSMFGLVGVAILYGVLQIGGDKKGWTQLD